MLRNVITLQFLIYNFVSLRTFRAGLMPLVVNTSPPPPLRTTSKLAKDLSSF